MGFLSNKISRHEVMPGDHIYSWRTTLRIPHVYAHHGIYVGSGQVIDFTRGGGRQTETGTFLDKMVVSSCPSKPPCLTCSNSGGVTCTCLDCFLRGGDLYRYEYNVSKATLLAKRGGTCTLAPSDSSESVLYRANFLLLQNGFGAYDFFENNCEDFAIYCKTSLVVPRGDDDDVIGLLKRSGASGQVHSAALIVVPLVLGIYGLHFYVSRRLRFDIGARGREDVTKISVEELIASRRPKGQAQEAPACGEFEPQSM